MEKFRSLRKKLASIHKDSAQKELKRKLEDQRKTEEEKLAHEKELEEQRLADENWLLIKEQVMDAFAVANRVALNGKGKITGWKKVKGLHHHSRFQRTHGYGQHAVDEYTEHEIRFRAEIAELKLEEIGKISIFRILSSDEKHEWETGRQFKRNDEIRKFVCIDMRGHWEMEDKLCHWCSPLRRGAETKSRISILDVPDIEELVSKALADIHETILLK